MLVIRSLQSALVKLRAGPSFTQACQFHQNFCVRGITSTALQSEPPNVEQKNSSNKQTNGIKALLVASGLLGIYTIKYRRKDGTSSSLFASNVYAATPFGRTNLPQDNEPPPNFSNKDNNYSNRKNFNFIADAVEKVIDSVVCIEIKDHRRRDMNGNIMPVSNGSGFVVKEDGLILTNAHVVSNMPRSSSICVRLENGEEYKAVIEELDANSDLALIRISCGKLSVATFGSSGDVRAGEFVVALGSPLSLNNSITSGVVSSVSREGRQLGLAKNNNIGYIQTDAAITFGNSGGPLINLDGEVIGINAMKVSDGFSFAIPIDTAKIFIEKANQKKSFLDNRQTSKRRYLGVTMLSLDSKIINELRHSASNSVKIPDDIEHGIFVWRLAVGSPAYEAGISPGDIITHINGQKICNSQEVYAILGTGVDLQMVVIRDGRKYSVTVCPED